MRPTLDEIGLKHGTNKASDRHDYLSRYEPFFEPMRDQPIHILEFGVDKGASMRTWLEYFPNALVVGVDHFNPARFKPDDPRCVVVIDDQLHAHDNADVRMHSPYHIIIDDGGHHNNEVIETFCAMWSKTIPENSLYIIEDLNYSYKETYNQPGYKISAQQWLSSIVLNEIHWEGSTRWANRKDGLEELKCPLTKRLRFMHWTKYNLIIGL